MAPLRLEPGAPDVFLETKLEKVARGEADLTVKCTRQDAACESRRAERFRRGRLTAGGCTAEPER